MNTREVKRVLNLVSKEAGLDRRNDKISEYFIGRPYIQNPLGGGPDEPEVFRASLAAFDCVTYIETVLALARSRTVDQFLDTLRLIRYEGGEIAWVRRNHYMVDWIRCNRRAGFIENLTRGKHAVKKKRSLSIVPGLPETRASFLCYPKRKIGSVRERIKTGDLILFASARKRLDVFHAGLLVVGDSELLLRHATRSAGAVVEQPLASFLGSNRMSGFILLRPVER
jgi:hypothetical protein